jgi:ribosomal protein L3 glutamine methyltransferase
LSNKNHPVTIASLIDELATRFRKAKLFYGHGTDNPDDEAFYLVMAALDLPFDLSRTQLDETPSAEAVQRIRHLADRRIRERIPVAYLVHRAWFCGQPYYVDERVLIPRSPVAELIQQGFEPWVDGRKVKRILDIGTGSGCIAIACAHAIPEAIVDAIDISAAALEVARQNVNSHGVQDRVHLYASDLYAALGDAKYDLIIANPPYVDAPDMDALPAEFRHEPALALAAGDDGLDLVRRIIAESADHMNPDAVLIVEVGNSEPAMEKAFPDLPMIWLDFERGGEGVFVVTRNDLKKDHC